ncbi:MAG: hypothetical protein IKW30_03780 [Lachnospiraceae bacterium]|nr:hypothetical protein [Lachnospiraceae bacterium]
MRQGKNWTKEEEDYLAEKWGTVSVGAIAKALGRSENAIIVRKYRLGLGSFLESGEYVSWNQLLQALGITGGTGYKQISWVRNRDFPIHTKRIHNNSFKIVYLEEWWKWAEKNRDLLDFSRFEENVLGVEPEWVKDKRKHDVEKARKYITTPWTKSEDEKLRRLVAKQQYSYDDLSKMLRRTNGAICRRLSDLEIKDRPIKADNHIRWTDDEFIKLGELIKAGYGYDLIAEIIGKSSKAIRGRVYQMYLTENLDKVRLIIGVGQFGDNRPDRKIKQWNVMNTEERIQTREEMIRLAAILQWKFKQQISETEWGEFFQKDMCENFCKDCLLTEGCDSCTNFKKIVSQNCKMCGKTFWEKKSNLYCPVCRDMRRKQWLRKRFVLNK